MQGARVHTHTGASNFVRTHRHNASSPLCIPSSELRAKPQRWPLTPQTAWVSHTHTFYLILPQSTITTTPLQPKQKHLSTSVPEDCTSVSLRTVRQILGQYKKHFNCTSDNWLMKIRFLMSKSERFSVIWWCRLSFCSWSSGNRFSSLVIPCLRQLFNFSSVSCWVNPSSCHSKGIELGYSQTRD